MLSGVCGVATLVLGLVFGISLLVVVSSLSVIVVWGASSSDLSMVSIVSMGFFFRPMAALPNADCFKLCDDLDSEASIARYDDGYIRRCCCCRKHIDDDDDDRMLTKAVEESSCLG